MSDFATVLTDQIGDSDVTHDQFITVSRCFFYDFDGYPTRLWDGQGILRTGDGSDWIGTVDSGGNDYHSVPNVDDEREGTSQDYTFSIPHIDETTFEALQSDRSLVNGRNLTCYLAIHQSGEGLRPGSPLRFDYRLEMMGAQFGRSMDLSGGTMTRAYSASVLAKPIGHGRSLVPGGTYTDTSQKLRAQAMGLDGDSGCGYVSSNSTRRIKYP